MKIVNRKSSAFLMLSAVLIAIVSISVLSPNNSKTEIIESEPALTLNITEEPGYSFSTDGENLIYGPYYAEGKKYYFSEGEVLNRNLNQVDNTKIRNLHNFYLKSYLDPFFYSPTSEIELLRFEEFEKDKVLARKCGLKYDLIPEQYFGSLEDNIESTNNFLNNATMKNAAEMQNSNQEVLTQYSDYIGDFVDLFDKNLSNNECFNGAQGYDGIDLVTDTNPGRIINENVVQNVTEMANKNARANQIELERRRAILNGSETFKFKVEKPEISSNRNYSDPYYSREEAKTLMNRERASQLIENRENIESISDSDREYLRSMNSDLDVLSKTQIEKSLSSLGKDFENDFVKLLNSKPEMHYIESTCDRKTIPTYGYDKYIYPNIISGDKRITPDQSQYTDNLFVNCRCPYVEEDRLEWLIVEEGSKKELNLDIISNENTANRATSNFVQNTGSKEYEELSESYEYILKKKLKNGEYHSDIPELWSRSTKQQSKVHKFGEAFEKFYNPRELRINRLYFFGNNEVDNLDRSQYQYFVLMESMYSLNFMDWSDSVWRLDNRPMKFNGTVEDVSSFESVN